MTFKNLMVLTGVLLLSPTASPESPSAASSNLRAMNGAFPQSETENFTIFSDSQRAKPAIVVDHQTGMVHAPLGLTAEVLSGPLEPGTGKDIVLRPKPQGLIDLSQGSGIKIDADDKVMIRNREESFSVPMSAFLVPIRNAELKFQTAVSSSATSRSINDSHCDNRHQGLCCAVAVSASCPTGYVASGGQCNFKESFSNWAPFYGNIRDAGRTLNRNGLSCSFYVSGEACATLEAKLVASVNCLLLELSFAQVTEEP